LLQYKKQLISFCSYLFYLLQQDQHVFVKKNTFDFTELICWQICFYKRFP